MSVLTAILGSTSEPSSGPPPPTYFGDDFNDNSFDEAKWTRSTTRINLALASNGATATASSTLGSNVPDFVIDGTRFSDFELWADNTSGVFGDWIQVEFPGTELIDEIDVFTYQDGVAIDPTLSTTFTLYGITAFDVEYWNGSAWVAVTGGNVTGNNKVWRQFTFTPVSTTKIRVVVNAGADNTYCRVTEIEAWGVGPSLVIEQNERLDVFGQFTDLWANASFDFTDKYVIQRAWFKAVGSGGAGSSGIVIRLVHDWGGIRNNYVEARITPGLDTQLIVATNGSIANQSDTLFGGVPAWLKLLHRGDTNVIELWGAADASGNYWNPATVPGTWVFLLSATPPMEVTEVRYYVISLGTDGCAIDEVSSNIEV